ncbi:MAG: hypothetical protein IT431_14610 [Phycisphaerales bacterium]|nr:hypothetical protein [Phycisphaerales bacterium]
MAGAPDRQMMSVAEAKARLRALDAPRSSTGGSLLANPTARAGAVLLGALVLGTTLGSRSRAGMIRSLGRVALRAAGVFGPILVARVARDLTGAPRAPAASGPGRASANSRR